MKMKRKGLGARLPGAPRSATRKENCNTLLKTLIMRVGAIGKIVQLLNIYTFFLKQFLRSTRINVSYIKATMYSGSRLVMLIRSLLCSLCCKKHLMINIPALFINMLSAIKYMNNPWLIGVSHLKKKS